MAWAGAAIHPTEVPKPLGMLWKTTCVCFGNLQVYLFFQNKTRGTVKIGNQAVESIVSSSQIHWESKNHFQVHAGAGT